MSLDTSFAVFIWKYWLYSNYQVGFVTTRSPLASLPFEVLATKCTAVKIKSLYLVLWIIIIIWGGMGKWGFWRQGQRNSKCMSSFWIGSILFSAHFLMVILVFLHPVISQLVFLLHILSLIIQEKASDAFTFLFLPSPPLGTKACQKRHCKFIVVTLSEQNKSSFHILSNARVRRYSHLKCSEKTFAVILFIPC